MIYLIDNVCYTSLGFVLRLQSVQSPNTAKAKLVKLKLLTLLCIFIIINNGTRQ